MSSLKMSIVVCSYNQAAFLGRTLESLIAQKDVGRDEFEIIVVDGGSKDGSADIIRALAPHFAWWVSEPDRGQTHALIKGFERATGSILGWLCSDDVLEPHTAREVLDYFAANPGARFIYGDARLIDEDDRIVRAKREIPFNWFIWSYDHNYIPQPSAFWTKDLYTEVGGLDESFDVAMDGDLFARFSIASPPRHVPRYWSRFRLQPNQKTQRLREQHDVAHRRICTSVGVANFSSPMRNRAAYLVAKSWRVCWKLKNGCYS
jgi:glycosyltransferase involved in cell wall biosynthesis